MKTYLLHPRIRDGLGVEVLDDDLDHENAYLEHDAHSEALVLFFLEYVQSYSMGPRGFKLVVYTRFDSEARSLHALSHISGVPEDVIDRGAPLLLELYNNIGSGITGFHYDPVFPTSEYDPTVRSSCDRNPKGKYSSSI